MAQVIINKKDKRASYRKKLNSIRSKGLDAKKYCGSIELTKNPLAIQKELRNEWK
ncbi:hypothetical protein BMS3Abin04_02750 [bacterium BMS3Abin04]|nr:hypothetical protein BMS3Abin04_02750 [bacterium BMS3Abin04]